jgi:hypothetical protein
MARRKRNPEVSPEGAAAEAGRRARLGAALRENLLKRKAQKRGRDDAARQAGPDLSVGEAPQPLEDAPEVK